MSTYHIENNIVFWLWRLGRARSLHRRRYKIEHLPRAVEGGGNRSVCIAEFLPLCKDLSLLRKP
jgi:hypothetical protein